jgi:hypothetical protein
MNPYAVLDAALSLLRLALALLALGLAVGAWRASRGPLSPERRQGLEDRSYLLALVGLVSLGLALVSWPLLYLLLQSYVPQWPGVMCVYGVTRIGTGSTGPARVLPGLLTALQLAKPALVFCGGAWLALYLVNRRTPTAPLAGRVLAALAALGLLAAGDAAGELAYLAIPKHEERPSPGCCTAAADDPSHGTWQSPDPVLGVGDRPVLTAAYYAVNGVMLIGLYASGVWSLGAMPTALRGHEGPSHAHAKPWAWHPTDVSLTLRLLGAAAVVPISAAFLVDVVAPVVLRLPYHHCPYDLLPVAPEAVLAAALSVAGTFCVGWAWVVARWGDCPEAAPFLPATVAAILRAAFFCYLYSVVMTSVELALSR